MCASKKGSERDMDIRVAINDEVEQQVLSHDEIERLVCAVLAGEECVEPCEVSVSFVTVEQIHEINREYRGIDKPTDVLSFNIDDPDDFDFEYDEDDEWDEGEDDPESADDASEDAPADLDEFDPEDDDDAEGPEADEGEGGDDGAFDPEADDLDDAFMLGDVILCPQIVEEQAAGFGNTVADEMRLLLVHGCLHLMGYDHEVAKEAEEMEELERWYLAAFASVPAEEINVGPTVDHAAEGTAAVPRP